MGDGAKIRVAELSAHQPMAPGHGFDAAADRVAKLRLRVGNGVGKPADATKESVTNATNIVEGTTGRRCLNMLPGSTAGGVNKQIRGYEVADPRPRAGVPA